MAYAAVPSNALYYRPPHPDAHDRGLVECSEHAEHTDYVPNVNFKKARKE